MVSSFSVTHSQRLLSLTVGGWDLLTPMAPVAEDFDLKREMTTGVFVGARLVGPAARPEFVSWLKDSYVAGLTACWGHLRDQRGAVEALAALVSLRAQSRHISPQLDMN